MKPVGDHHHGLLSPTPATNISTPFPSGDAALFGKGRHKTWALAAIALLALWSMFAASVTLRWSSGDFASTFSDACDTAIDDLDPLEMEEREKLVRRMWDVYTRTGDHVPLPLFWQVAFEAAYEELAGDDMQASDTAVSEIARMSIRRPDVENSWNKTRTEAGET